jgi:aminodeoxyfutalosine deaminase
MRASGTVACGDIGNTDAALPALARAGMTAVHFSEVLGFRADGTRAAARWAAVRSGEAGGRARLARGVAPHAPYSTSPSLIAGVVAGLDQGPRRRASIHLGESPEELRFLRHGDGPWREMLEAFGTWNPEWSPPGCSPVEYLDALGALHPRLLVVHGTHLPDGDFERLALAGCTIVVCARSNRWVGVGDPPISRMIGAGVSLAVGTDSLASAPDLDMFAELAHLRALARDVSASHLLEAATRGGALALGFDDLGAIAPGMRADLLVVRGPAPEDGVEEWLLSGAVTPDDVDWLATTLPPQTVAAVH